MNTRPSLGFDDDDVPANTPAPVLDLSEFQPKAVARPDREKTAEAAQKANFKSREPKAVATPEVQSAPAVVIPRDGRQRRRTGRNAQINLKATAETIARFYKVADDNNLIYGDAFDKAVALLEKQYAK